MPAAGTEHVGDPGLSASPVPGIADTAVVDLGSDAAIEPVTAVVTELPAVVTAAVSIDVSAGVELELPGVLSIGVSAWVADEAVADLLPPVRDPADSLPPVPGSGPAAGEQSISPDPPVARGVDQADRPQVGPCGEMWRSTAGHAGEQEFVPAVPLPVPAAPPVTPGPGLSNGTACGSQVSSSGNGVVGNLSTDPSHSMPPLSVLLTTASDVAVGIPAAEPAVSPD